MERGALDTASWYLTDRVWKRRGARVLRGGAAAGAVAGAALALLDLTGAVGGVAPWGYLALLLGVACVAGDRFFGVTSGWIRDVATAQAVQRRLQVLQFDWASESVREVLGPTEGDRQRGGGSVSGGVASVLGRVGVGAGGDDGLDGGVPDRARAVGDPVVAGRGSSGGGCVGWAAAVTSGHPSEHASPATPGAALALPSPPPPLPVPSSQGLRPFEPAGGCPPPAPRIVAPRTPHRPKGASSERQDRAERCAPAPLQGRGELRRRPAPTSSRTNRAGGGCGAKDQLVPQIFRPTQGTAR